MEILIDIIKGLIIFIHLYVVWLEMFNWQLAINRLYRESLSPEVITKTKALMQNQGLYNAFLVAGLLWTFFISDFIWRENLEMFFMGCIVLAGIYGAYTIDKKIFYIQALPAIVGVLLIIWA